MKLFRLPPTSHSEVRVAFLEAVGLSSKILLQVETGQWAGVGAGSHRSRPRCNAKSTGLWSLGHKVHVLVSQKVRAAPHFPASLSPLARFPWSRMPHPSQSHVKNPLHLQAQVQIPPPPGTSS